MARRVVSAVSLLLLSFGVIIGLPGAKADPSRQEATPTSAPLSVDPATHLENGIRYLTEEFDTPAAYTEFNMALDHDEELWEAYWWRAKLYYDVGANRLALADLTTLLQHDPDHVAGLTLRAQVYAGPFRVDIPYNDLYLDQVGHRGFGYYGEFAWMDIERALVLDPNNLAVILALGDVLLAEWSANYRARVFDDTVDYQQTYDDAVSAYLAAMMLGAGDPLPYYKYGFIILIPGPYPFDSEPNRVEFAREYLIQAADLMPDTPQAANIRAVLSLGSGNADEARAIMTEALTQFPNYAPLQHWATMLARNIFTPGFSDDDAQFAMLTETSLRATELAPYSPVYWLTYLQNTELTYDQRVAIYDRLLVETPGYPPALYQLALLVLSARSTEADCSLAKALSVELKASVLDRDTALWWLVHIEDAYAKACVAPTPTAAPSPAANARYQPGETVQLPRLVVFALNSTPQGRDQSIICTGGSTATVLQTVVLDEGLPVNYVQLECDGGIGWIQEALLN